MHKPTQGPWNSNFTDLVMYIYIYYVYVVHLTSVCASQKVELVANGVEDIGSVPGEYTLYLYLYIYLSPKSF